MFTSKNCINFLSLEDIHQKYLQTEPMTRLNNSMNLRKKKIYSIHRKTPSLSSKGEIYFITMHLRFFLSSLIYSLHLARKYSLEESAQESATNKEKWISKWNCIKVESRILYEKNVVVDETLKEMKKKEITFVELNRQKTRLSVFRFNPLFIQFTFPISLLSFLLFAYLEHFRVLKDIIDLQHIHSANRFFFSSF